MIKKDESSNSEELPESELKIHKHKKLLETRRYVIAYVNWYRATKGLWRTFSDFWGRRFLLSMWFTVFRQIGVAIGGFLMKKYIMDRLGMQEYYTFKAEIAILNWFETNKFKK